MLNLFSDCFQASKAKAEGITMMAVGIGKKIYQKELDEIASNTKMISVISDFGSLANDVNSLGNLICKCKFVLPYR